MLFRSSEFEQAWQQLADDSRSRQQSYEPHYEGSAVVAGPPGGVCSIHGKYGYPALAGHHLTPQVLSSGKNVYEELGQGFTLLAFGANDQMVTGFHDAAEALHVPLKVVRDDAQDGRAKYEASLILVRPDQYVVWTGSDSAASPSAVLRTATGRS